MKVLFLLFAVLFSTGFGCLEAFAQKKTVTIIIFRHADRETPVEGDDSDPDLSIEGQKRAVRLVKILEKYKPTRIFSTNYARTLQTVTPLSRINNVPVETYVPGDFKEFADGLLSLEEKRTIAVVGHNSTSFLLANHFLKNSKYTMPADSDYAKIWILRIKNGKVKDQVITY